MNDSILTVGVLALDIAWADKETNLKVVREYVCRYGREIDLLVLPELFTTAFAQDINVLPGLAEDDNGITISELRELSREYDVAIGGSYLAKLNDNYYNRGFIILPDGNGAFYNKRHLFGLSAESRMFTPGTDLPAVVTFKGWRLALIVCYDLRFPVWCRRNDCNCQYDLLMVVANWPISRRYAWKHLLIARAIENQAVVVGADRSGRDDFGEYDGMTYVYDCTGHEVDMDVKDNMLTVSRVSLDQLSEMRRRWPMANDADRFRVL
ncbi:MAG: nitrilase family protein [Muribaculaceae bacterium]|nr:nitrilase family protein [Muribaculaceae bacterium]